MNELSDFGRRLSNVTDSAAVRRILNKAGMAGKATALEAASESLGGDRMFSGMRRKAPLKAGYDLVGSDTVKIGFRPAGLWVLADQGRKRSGRIYPRAGSRKGQGPVTGRAVSTPDGPRASSQYRPSRGLGTFDDAVTKARRKVPRAAANQFRSEVAKVVKG